MKLGKTSETESGHRCFSVNADKGMEFVGVNLEGIKVTTDSITLSGRAIGHPPKTANIDTRQVGRITRKALEGWLKQVPNNELHVSEDVIVDLGNGHYICGSGDGSLHEAPKAD